MIAAHCNICLSPLGDLASHREQPDCSVCGSHRRFRAVVHALSLALHGESLPLAKWKANPEIAILGFTDWQGYAGPLASRFAYVNTYYHQQPHLDLCRLPESLLGRFDFVICSEVLEHVPPPVSRAVAGLSELLAPQGSLILTTPHSRTAQVKEHFPELADYNVSKDDEGWLLENTTPSGDKQIFRDLVFHGGPGETLEMRQFSTEQLKQLLQRAGLEQIACLSHDEPRFGIVWGDDGSYPFLAHKPAAESHHPGLSLQQRLAASNLTAEIENPLALFVLTREAVADPRLLQALHLLCGEKVTVLFYSYDLEPEEAAYMLRQAAARAGLTFDVLPDSLVIAESADRSERWAQTADAVLTMRRDFPSALLAGRVISEPALLIQLFKLTAE